MKFSKKWFTMIELMVVIAILALLFTLSYAPYVYYQNKTSLKLAWREISQAFYEAKNMAISWVDWQEKNQSIWVFIDTKDWEDSTITFLWYDYDFLEADINKPDLKSSLKIKEKKLQTWVMIDKILWENNVSLLILYEAITWKINIYKFSESWVRTDVLDEKIKIKFSFKNSTLETLQKEIYFYTKTNIIDYE